MTALCSDLVTPRPMTPQQHLARLEAIATDLLAGLAALRAEMAAHDAAEFPALDIGRAIQVARARIGMKRPALAVAAGISYPYLAEIETGHKNPSMAVLRRIAEALGVPITELIGA